MTTAHHYYYYSVILISISHDIYIYTEKEKQIRRTYCKLFGLSRVCVSVMRDSQTMAQTGGWDSDLSVLTVFFLHISN